MRFMKTSLSLIALTACLTALTSPSIQAKTISTSSSQVVVGQDALNSAITAIKNAKSRIDLDMYEFTNTAILQALVSAHKHGVKERVILK